MDLGDRLTKHFFIFCQKYSILKRQIQARGSTQPRRLINPCSLINALFHKKFYPTKCPVHSYISYPRKLAFAVRFPALKKSPLIRHASTQRKIYYVPAIFTPWRHTLWRYNLSSPEARARGVQNSVVLASVTLLAPGDLYEVRS